jgi:hypothetical protein
MAEIGAALDFEALLLFGLSAARRYHKANCEHCKK